MLLLWVASKEGKNLPCIHQLDEESSEIWHREDIAILVVYNQFTKMAYFIATTEKTSAEGLVRLFWDQV